jgi:hypothetical protein
MKKQEENFKRLKLSGIGMLIFNFVFLVAIVVAFVWIDRGNFSKVNDKKGNPVMIGQVLVWRVTDTYKASFDIDNTSMITVTNAGTLYN